MLGRRKLFASVSALIVLGALAVGSAPAAAYSNPAPIAIPDQGAATPNPSTISVDGRSGVVTDVAVTLHRVSHERIRDVHIALVSPDGDVTILMSDTCGAGGIPNPGY